MPTSAEKNARRRAFNKDLVAEAKNRPCADCGVSYPTCVMEFDHRPGEPFLFHIAGMYWKSAGQLRAEIAKCDVVCANCHRIRTHTREGAYGPRST